MTADDFGSMIEETLLGGPLCYTRAEVEGRAGVSDEFARRIWRALGFPTPPDGEPAFTDADVAALREIRDLLDHDLVNEEMVFQLVRAVGQTMGRLASWLTDARLRWMSELLPPDEPVTPEIVDAALAATEELRPAFERLLLHGWRRELAAASMRAAATTATAPAAGVANLAVGFADIVSFTKLSRGMDGETLAMFVDRFESSATEIVADTGGRVVKTLGDEVLFMTSDPVAAAETGLRIAERLTEDPDFPRVRVGMAYGEVIQHLGDVFGTPVNLAARLTSTAHAGAVLVDGGMAAALPEEYDLTGLRPRPLQGLGRVRPWLLRRRKT